MPPRRNGDYLGVEENEKTLVRRKDNKRTRARKIVEASEARNPKKEKKLLNRTYI